MTTWYRAEDRVSAHADDVTERHGPRASVDLRSRGALLCLAWVTCQMACKTATQADKPAALDPAPEAAIATAPTANRGEPMPELPPGIHQQTVSGVDGATLRYTILVPDGYSRATPAPLIVMLHYAGTVTPFYGRGMIDGLAQPAFAPLHAIVIAPDSLGGDWTTAQNGAAVVWLTRAIMKRYAVDPGKVVLSGYSMGGIGTWYIGSKNQDLFTAAIPVASAPAGDPSWTIPLYVIHSRDDHVLPIGPVRDEVARLKAAGAHVEWRELTGPTHYDTSAFIPAVTDAGRWLAQSWSGAGIGARP